MWAFQEGTCHQVVDGVRRHFHTHTHTHTRKQTYTHVSKHPHKNPRPCTRTHAHTQMHTHTHAHMHACTHSHSWVPQPYPDPHPCVTSDKHAQAHRHTHARLQATPTPTQTLHLLGPRKQRRDWSAGTAVCACICRGQWAGWAAAAAVGVRGGGVGGRVVEKSGGCVRVRC